MDLHANGPFTCGYCLENFSAFLAATAHHRAVHGRWVQMKVNFQYPPPQNPPPPSNPIAPRPVAKPTTTTTTTPIQTNPPTNEGQVLGPKVHTSSGAVLRANKIHDPNSANIRLSRIRQETNSSSTSQDSKVKKIDKSPVTVGSQEPKMPELIPYAPYPVSNYEFLVPCDKLSGPPKKLKIENSIKEKRSEISTMNSKPNAKQCIVLCPYWSRMLSMKVEKSEDLPKHNPHSHKSKSIAANRTAQKSKSVKAERKISLRPRCAKKRPKYREDSSSENSDEDDYIFHKTNKKQSKKGEETTRASAAYAQGPEPSANASTSPVPENPSTLVSPTTRLGKIPCELCNATFDFPTGLLKHDLEVHPYLA